jgi:hypothetical protein
MKLLYAGGLTLLALAALSGGQRVYQHYHIESQMEAQLMPLLTTLSADWSPLSLRKVMDPGAYEEKIATYLPMLDKAVVLGPVVACNSRNFDGSVARHGDKRWALEAECQFAQGSAHVTLLFPRDATTPVVDLYILK